MRHALVSMLTGGLVACATGDPHDYSRDWGYGYACSSEGGERDMVDLPEPPPRGPARVRWTAFLGTGNGDTVETCADLPFDQGSSIVYLEARRFLVSGFRFEGESPTSGRGVIAQIRIESVPRRRIIVESTREYAGIDPYTLFWSARARLLFAIDYREKRLVAADWAGAAAAPPEESAFGTAATAAAIPILTHAAATLSQPDDAGDLLVQADDGLHSRFLVVRAGASWSIQDLTPDWPLGPPRASKVR